MSKISELHKYHNQSLCDLRETGVYKIEHLSHPGEVYIGSTQNCFYERWIKHYKDLEHKIHHSHYLQRVIDKYGFSGLQFSIIVICPIESCVSIEQYWLDKSNCTFNSLKFARSCKGKKLSDEQKANLSKFHTGKLKSDITRDRLRLANLGQIPWNKGIKNYMSAEGAVKLQESKYKPVMQFTREGELINSYKSITEAAKHLNCNRGTIYEHLRGARKSVFGFIFKYN